MRAYDRDDESLIRTSKLVREWTRSGLIEPPQAAVIEPELRTELRRTNLILRIVLFGFAMSVLQSILGLFLLVIDTNDKVVVGSAAIAAGVATALLAEFLIGRLQFYRFGVEEACAVLAAGLVTGGIVVLWAAESEQFLFTVALSLASAAALATYARYGYRYAALVAIAAAAAVPFTLDLSMQASRLLSALVLLATFVAARSLRNSTEEEFLEDEVRLIESAAWLGLYAVLNLQLDILWSSPTYTRTFFLGTYAAIWILPSVGLVLGIRGRHRWMIWVNIFTALVTLSTNKMYLGWPRHTWDPILLGLLLIVIAVGVRRWLSAGPSGERAGFTPRRILLSDKVSLSIVSTVAGAVQPGPTHQASTSAPDTFQPGGGSSGGGGASGKF